MYLSVHISYSLPIHLATPLSSLLSSLQIHYNLFMLYIRSITSCTLSHLLIHFHTVHILLDDHLDPYSRTLVSQSNHYPAHPDNLGYLIQILSFMSLHSPHYPLLLHHSIMFILHSCLDVSSNRSYYSPILLLIHYM